MKAFITSIEPNPISVHSGDTTDLKVSVIAMDDVSGAHLVIANKKTEAAQLFDTNESADTIHSAPKDLSSGLSELTHQVGFRLEQIAAASGAIIGVEIFVADSDGDKISPEERLLATIGARS